MTTSETPLTSVEICAGAGGQAVGLHGAGFRHLALVEIDTHAATALRKNVNERKGWEWERKNGDVLTLDVKSFSREKNLPKVKPRDLDLLAGGVPCPPFSLAGKQLGQYDERDLFPEMLRLVKEFLPKAVMIENVRGLLQPAHKFADYRKEIESQLDDLGYTLRKWEIIEAARLGVPQLRPRAILVAIHEDYQHGEFVWPGETERRKSVFDALDDTMKRRYEAAKELYPEKASRLDDAYVTWRKKARVGGVAPTLVGGSKKHGGADLGPSRAKAAWKLLGVDGLGVANDEGKDIVVERDLLDSNGPKLTVEQAAIIQGFPDNWHFEGGKTARYRQVGNAFPPPVAQAFGEEIRRMLLRARAAKAGSPNPPATLTVSGDASSSSPDTSSPLRDPSSDLECATVG